MEFGTYSSHSWLKSPFRPPGLDSRACDQPAGMQVTGRDVTFSDKLISIVTVFFIFFHIYLIALHLYTVLFSVAIETLIKFVS